MKLDVSDAVECFTCANYKLQSLAFIATAQLDSQCHAQLQAHLLMSE